MNNELKKKINLYVGLGVTLEIIYAIFYSSKEGLSFVGTTLLLSGIILITIGCWHYAKSKGYPGYLGLLCLPLNIFGLMILAALPDKNKKSD